MDFTVGVFQFLHVLRAHIAHPHSKFQRNQTINDGVITILKLKIWGPTPATVYNYQDRCILVIALSLHCRPIVQRVQNFSEIDQSKAQL